MISISTIKLSLFIVFISTFLEIIIISSGYSTDSVCSIHQFECEYSYPISCIPLSLRCDGYPDCRDRSDEKDCPKHKCNETEFACNSTNKCIFLAWRCDGEIDCEDGSDEINCLNCKPHQFRCTNNKCIDKKYVCNHVDDCDDNSDESIHACMFHRSLCTKDEYNCKNGHCISLKLACNGIDDCGDNSDENLSNCTSCFNDEFKCKKNNECISRDKLCDQINDCPNGEDEFDCNHIDNNDDNNQNNQSLNCQINEFQCHNLNECIADYLVCDQKFDCSDNSDELNCTYFCDFEDEFSCNNGIECIPISMYCDGTFDCSDHSDEIDCRIIEDKSKSNNDTSCKRGLRWNPKLRRCFDINECIEDYSLCSGQTCVNTFGNFFCECLPGFKVFNETYCIRSNHDLPNQLIYSTNNSLNSLQWSQSFMETPKINNSSEIFQFMNNDKISYGGSNNDRKTSQIIFDYNLDDNYYVISNEYGQIYMNRLYKNRSINLTGISYPVLLTQCHHHIKSFTIDWLNHLLYLINTDMNHIEVIKLMKPNSVMVFVDRVENPLDIKVNPIESWIIWSENGRIIRLSQDGNEKKVLIDYDMMPTSLTIDYLTKQIYWIDKKSFSLYSMKFDGRNQRLILESQNFLRHSYDIDVFDNFVMWNDVKNGSLYAADKFGRDSNIYRLIENNNLNHNINLINFETIDSYKQPRNDSYVCPLNCPYRCDPLTLSCICPKPYSLCMINKINDSDDKSSEMNYYCSEKCSPHNIHDNATRIISMCFKILFIAIIIAVIFILIKCCQNITELRKINFKVMKLNTVNRSIVLHYNNDTNNNNFNGTKNCLTNDESSSANLTKNVSILYCDEDIDNDINSGIDSRTKKFSKKYSYMNKNRIDNPSSGYSSSAASSVDPTTMIPYYSFKKKTKISYQFDESNDDNQNNDTDHNHNNNNNNHNYDDDDDERLECLPSSSSSESTSTSASQSSTTTSTNQTFSYNDNNLFKNQNIQTKKKFFI